MQKFQWFLFVLNRSYICYYIICMTVRQRRSFKIICFLDIFFVLGNEFAILKCDEIDNTRLPREFYISVYCTRSDLKNI